jgi:hypothetical protein
VPRFLAKLRLDILIRRFCLLRTCLNVTVLWLFFPVLLTFLKNCEPYPDDNVLVYLSKISIRNVLIDYSSNKTIYPRLNTAFYRNITAIKYINSSVEIECGESSYSYQSPFIHACDQDDGPSSSPIGVDMIIPNEESTSGRNEKELQISAQDGEYRFAFLPTKSIETVFEMRSPRPYCIIPSLSASVSSPTFLRCPDKKVRILSRPGKDVGFYLYGIDRSNRDETILLRNTRVSDLVGEVAEPVRFKHGSFNICSYKAGKTFSLSGGTKIAYLRISDKYEGLKALLTDLNASNINDCDFPYKNIIVDFLIFIASFSFFLQIIKLGFSKISPYHKKD